jgi:hypothetical protein
MLTMKNKFLKFRVLSNKEPHEVGDLYETLILNIDHLVSIKPINIVIEGDVQKGYWIRTSNDKKYRAIEIPDILLELVEDIEVED